LALDKPKILAAAQKHLGRGNVDRALKELGRIVRDDPKDLRVRQKVAELLARQGKIPDAMREFHVVADSYERGGFFPKAAAIYKQMLRFEPNEMQWHMALGTIYQQLALLSDSQDHFNRVAAHFENNGTPRERIEVFERLVALNPDTFEYSERLSELHQREGDPDSAYGVWARVAQSLQNRGETEALLPVLERMSALRENDLDLVRTLANLYLDRKDPRRALAKLQECFRADPQDTETLNLLADAFVDLGENEKAVAVLRELAQIYGDLGYAEYRDQVYDRIADLDVSDGQAYGGDASLVVEGLQDPVAHIEVVQEGSDEEVIQRPLIAAATFLAYGFPDRAHDALEASIARFPASFALHKAVVPLHLYFEQLGAVHESLEAMYEIAMDHSDYAAARACLEAAVAISPDDEGARGRLQAFLSALGEFGTGTEASPAVEDDGMEDFGEAIALSQRIAESSSRAPADIEGDASGFGDFDFDDSEMQALANQLSRELGGGEDLDLDFDPLAGLDLEGFDDFDETPKSAFELGKDYYENGSYEDAREELQRAVDAGEELVPALEMLGITCRRLRDFRSAVECFRRLLADRLVSGMDQLRVLFEIGVTYEAAGNRRSAYKVYKRIVGADPTFRDGEVQNRLSSLELELGMG
jgi:tetratricopeptide (TPR) repeat protein